MRNLLFSIFIVALVLGTYYGYQFWDKQLNYTQVTASVLKIEKLCHLEKTTQFFKTNKRTKKTDSAPCSDIRNSAQKGAKYSGYKVVEDNFVDVTYSDADGAEHMATVRQDGHADGRPIAVGDQLPVLIDNDAPQYAQPL